MLSIWSRFNSSCCSSSVLSHSEDRSRLPDNLSPLVRSNVSEGCSSLDDLAPKNESRCSVSI